MSGNPIAGVMSRVGADIVTGGLAETNVGNGIFKKGGKMVGDALTLGTGPNPFGLGGNNGAPGSPAGANGQQSPLQVLQSTGGAPLLSSIALGVKPEDALASYFGQSPESYSQWVNSLSPEDQNAIKGLTTSLTSISTDVNLKNQTLQNLVKDFPNFMQSQTQKYASIMSDATKSAVNDYMGRALDQTAAKYAANGSLSSGAMAAASARVGAETGLKTAEDSTAFGANLALQDWSQQYSESSALRNFQMKMMGMGAEAGFNAIQNNLQREATGSMTTQKIQADKDIADQNAKNAMWGGVGKLAGTALGLSLGGPVGGMVGSQVGEMVAPQANDASLNMPGNERNA